MSTGVSDHWHLGAVAALGVMVGWPALALPLACAALTRRDV